MFSESFGQTFDSECLFRLQKWKEKSQTMLMLSFEFLFWVQMTLTSYRYRVTFLLDTLGSYLVEPLKRRKTTTRSLV